MRHYTLTAVTLTALLLSSCAEGPQNEVDASPSPELTSSRPESAQQDIGVIERGAETVVELMDPAALTARYHGLDSKDISQAEIDELIGLQAAQAKASQVYQAEIQAWAAQDASRRGPQPTFNGATLSQDKNERLRVLSSKLQIAEMRKRYQSFDPKDISQAEIDELIALQQAQMKTSEAFQKKLQAWSAQDPTRRGPQPAWQEASQSERLMALNSKVLIAEIRKKYENFDPKVLSKAEVEEMIALEQDQQRKMLAYQEELQAWAKQDAATRGPQPQMDPATYMGGNNPRMQALQAKIRGAQQVQRFTARIQKLSKTHNLSISDTELSELTALQTEQQEFRTEMNKAMMEAANAGQFGSGNLDPTTAIENMPKDVLQRMFEVGQRIEAIEGPLKAAEKADGIREQMTRLSETSGIPVLSGEISETIALNAEKDRIQNRARLEAGKKWLIEGGSIMAMQQALPNAEDYARLKEIEARIKAISAPMTEAHNAAQDAKNPVMKQYRLAQEEREKWQTDWQDRKQAGEIPADAQMNSPTYAEIQDRVQDYNAKLQSRAEKAGYNISASELNRLETLNEQMVTIRKAVHDMEVDGSSTVDSGNGYKTPSFGLTSGMYKIRKIEQKQREILAGLTEAEMPRVVVHGGSASQIGTRQFDHRNSEVFNGGQYGAAARAGVEAIIQSSRAQGLEISQSDEDDLLAFERELADR